MDNYALNLVCAEHKLRFVTPHANYNSLLVACKPSHQLSFPKGNKMKTLKKQIKEPTDQQKQNVMSLLKQIDKTVKITVGNSNTLIETLYDIKFNNHGFNVLKVKRWSEFFVKYITHSTYSSATLYHYGEVVDFCDKHNITPGNETLPSVRAICSIRKKDRERIWQDCLILSDGNIPSPELINDEGSTLKGSGQPTKRKSAKQIMQQIEDRSDDDLKALLTEIEEVMNALSLDELGLRSISLEELQKLEALITDKIKNQSE